MTEPFAAEARRSWEVQRTAMVAGDARGLGRLLADDFTLTHMTGFVQSRDDWLADVESGAMRYHSITDDDVSVEPTGNGIVLTARTHTDATIWGGRGTWRLQLELQFLDVDDGALTAYTIASTW